MAPQRPSMFDSDIRKDTSMPWQAKFFAFIGFPAVVATYLVWVLTNNVGAEHKSLQDSINELTTVQKDYYAQQLYLSIMQCRAVVKTEDQRQQCSNAVYVKGNK